MKQYTALVVGAGEMGRAWLRTLSTNPRTKIIGVVETNPATAAATMEALKLSSVPFTNDLEKSLAELKPDFVLDVTPPSNHRAVTLAALKSGAHVLGEKPMADSMTAAREMVIASERAGKLYMVSQSRRYDVRVEAFRRLIQEHVGTPAILTSDFFEAPRIKSGFRLELKHVLLQDMAIHAFDNARQITSTDPVNVWCESYNPPWSWFSGNACAEAHFQMTGGLRYSYRGSWCALGHNTSWQAEWRAYGPGGSAVWDGDNAPVAAIKSEKIVAQLPEHVPGGIDASLREFIKALDTGDIPQGECHDNIKSIAMVFAAVESAETSKRVKIEI